MPNLSWSFVEDAERGSVLQVEHGPGFAGLFFSSTETRICLTIWVAC